MVRPQPVPVKRQMHHCILKPTSHRHLETDFVIGCNDAMMYTGRSWHGNVYRALQIVEDLECDLDSGIDPTERETKLLKAVSEFHHSIEVNQAFIPNYGDRYRHGEAISSAFVESTVNQVISKRMVKKQQMRWTQRGAHLAAAGPHAGPERRPPAHIRALVSGPEDRHRANPGSRRIAPCLARSLKRGPLQRRPQGKQFWSVLVPSRKASKTNPGHRPR